MGLKDALSTPPHVDKGPRCSVKVILDSLDGEDRAALETAIDDLAWTCSSIFRALNKEGHTGVSETALRRHRQRMCKCRPHQS